MGIKAMQERDGREREMEGEGGRKEGGGRQGGE